MSPVVRFIENEFNTQCLNTDTNKLESSKPELYFYEEYCHTQVVNIFNYDDPCDGRLADTTNSRSTQVNQNIFERFVTNFTYLEALNVEGKENGHESYTLTKLMLKNLIHLTMTLFARVDAYYIDEIISTPCRNISQNLKATHLENSPNMKNTILESNICDLIEIRYIFISLVFIYSIPFDGISQKRTQLTYFEMMGNLASTYVDPQFWLLPNLEAVIFDYCRINETSFNHNSFLGYCDKILKGSLDGNEFLCLGSINIDNGDFNGFRYVTNDKHNNGQTFDPCATVCSVSNGSYSSIGCYLSRWKDGVCHAFCDTEDY